MRLPDVKTVAVDIEASGLHPDDGARVASVGVAWGSGCLLLPFDQGELDKHKATQLDIFEGENPNLTKAEWMELLAWLGTRRLVFHNAKYDLMMLKAGTRHWEGEDLLEALAWDTMVVSSLLDPRQSESLENAGHRAGLNGKVGEKEVKDWLRKHRFDKGRYDLAPWYVIKPYLERDVTLTWKLYKHQQNRLAKNGCDHAQLRREHQLLKVLARVESRGLRYDSKASLDAAVYLETQAAAVGDRLPFKATEPAAKEYFKKQKCTFDRQTATGKPSMDAEQVQKWADEGVPWAETWAEFTKMKRAASMWYRGFAEKVGPDGRLRTTFRQTKVKSGRMSVERVQLQAIPHDDKTLEGLPDVRSLVTPPIGHDLWSLDLAQAELRVAASYAQCETMLKEIADPESDLHGQTAVDVLEVKPTARDWKYQRNIAKRLNFSAIFQVGAEKFQAVLSRYGYKLPLEECQRIIRAWRSKYPEFTVAHRRAERKAYRDGWVRLLPGTEYEVRSWFGEGDEYKAAWSRMVQGSLAEFFKLWQIEVEREAPGILVLTIHDSLLLEIPRAGAGKAKAREMAGIGQDMATRLFQRPETGVTMPVDVEKW